MASFPPWQGRSRRWSISTLLRVFRAALWQNPQFRSCWSTPIHDWAEIDRWIAVRANTAAFSSRF
jgi:hypothetical protein